MATQAFQDFISLNVHKTAGPAYNYNIRITELYQAVYNQDIELTKSLLDIGVDPNNEPIVTCQCTKVFPGLPPILHIAKPSEHISYHRLPAERLMMVKILITHPHRPANPNLPFKGDSMIHCAIQDNDIDLACLLLSESRIKVDVNFVDQDGYTPLVHAMKKENFPIIKLLLDAGADLHLPCFCDVRNEKRWTPFMFAVKEKKDLRMCKLLLDSGYDVYRPIFNKYSSAVHLAAANDITLLKYLVETCRADVFAESQTNRWMLGDVISSEKVHTLEYLLHHGFQHRGNEIWWTGDDLLHHAVYNPVCITVLLRWGLNNAVGKVRVLDMKYILKSLYRISYGNYSEHRPNINNPVPADTGSYRKFMKLLKQMYPQCLQERKFIESRQHLNSYSQEVQNSSWNCMKNVKIPHV